MNRGIYGDPDDRRKLALERAWADDDDLAPCWYLEGREDLRRSRDPEGTARTNQIHALIVRFSLLAGNTERTPEQDTELATVRTKILDLGGKDPTGLITIQGTRPW